MKRTQLIEIFRDAGVPHFAGYASNPPVPVVLFGSYAPRKSYHDGEEWRHSAPILPSASAVFFLIAASDDGMLTGYLRVLWNESGHRSEAGQIHLDHYQPLGFVVHVTGIDFDAACATYGMADLDVVTWVHDQRDMDRAGGQGGIQVYQRSED